MSALLAISCVLATQRGHWTEQHVDGSFQGTTAIHIFEPVGKFSAEVVVGPSTSQRAM
jgi:hypothetical protein